MTSHGEGFQQMGDKNTPSMNELVKIYQTGELTQAQVQAWLESLPEEERDEAKNSLELGLSFKIENLPK